jgi:hypothetical protein
MHCDWANGGLQLQVERVDDRRPGDPERGADDAAEQALDDRLGAHPADDEPLVPAQRLQRAALADALLDP